jgi:amino acid permease
MVNPLYASLLTMNRLTYNQARSTGKLNMLAAFFLLFKSTVGLGLFSYPYVFSKVGIGYGIIFGCFICYITLYGIFTLANLSNKLENGFLVPKITSYDELVEFLAEKAIGVRAAKLFSTLCILCCVIINGSVIIGAIIEISQILSGYFKVSQITFKLIIIGVYLILAAVIIEPESLKPYAFLSSAVVISISTFSVIFSHYNVHLECDRVTAAKH